MVVQYLDDEQKPGMSAYLAANQPIPAYPGSDWRPPEQGPVVIRKGKFTTGDWVLGSVSLATAIGGGVVVGFTQNAYTKYCTDPSGAYYDDCANSDYYQTTLMPGWIVGYSLIGVGVAGMITTGIRVAVRKDEVSVALSGRW
jgi:hypothetical protein